MGMGRAAEILGGRQGEQKQSLTGVVQEAERIYDASRLLRGGGAD